MPLFSSKTQKPQPGSPAAASTQPFFRKQNDGQGIFGETDTAPFFDPVQAKPEETAAVTEEDPQVEQVPEKAVAKKEISVTETNRKYFLTAGIKLFKTNLANGFSALGAAFTLGQSATESGYGDPKGLERKIKANNFWGMKHNDKVINYSSFEEGHSEWKKMMDKKFSSAVGLMKQETFGAAEMQKGLNPGKGKQNYDPGNDNYASYMLDTSKNVMKRMIVVIDEQIKLKTAENAILVKKYTDDKSAAGQLGKAKSAALLAEIKDYEETKVKAQTSMAAVEKALSAK